MSKGSAPKKFPKGQGVRETSTPPNKKDSVNSETFQLWAWTTNNPNENNNEPSAHWINQAFKPTRINQNDPEAVKFIIKHLEPWRTRIPRPYAFASQNEKAQTAILDSTIIKFENVMKKSLNSLSIPSVLINLIKEYIHLPIVVGSGDVNRHSGILCENGKFFLWGNGRYGQLGQGNVSPSFDLPIEVPFFKSDNPNNLFGLGRIQVLNVACGYYHTLVLTNYGVFSFGYGAAGQLGEDTKESSVPLLINYFSKEKIKIISIAAGANHNICLSDQHILYSFGLNDEGQLGLGDYKNRFTPVESFNLNKVKPKDNKPEKDNHTLSPTNNTLGNSVNENNNINTNKSNNNNNNNNDKVTEDLDDFESLGFEDEVFVNKYKVSVGLIACSESSSMVKVDENGLDLVYLCGACDKETFSQDKKYFRHKNIWTSIPSLAGRKINYLWGSANYLGCASNWPSPRPLKLDQNIFFHHSHNHSTSASTPSPATIL